MANLIALRQIRENELYDYVNSLLSSGLNNVSGVSGILGVSGIYGNYNGGNITVGFTGATVTGSHPLGNFNFSGISGTQIILSGDNILIGGGGGASNSSTDSYEQINISGNAINTAAPSGRNHSIYLDISSGFAGNYNGTLILPTGNKTLGDKISVCMSYEASTRPDVQIYNNTVGPNNILFSWSGDGTQTKILTEFAYTGLGYMLWDAHFIN